MNAKGRGTRLAMIVALLPMFGCYLGMNDVSGQVDGEGADSGDSGDSGDDGPPTPLCEGGATPIIGLRFLTRTEYHNTVRDLLGEPVDVTSAFAPDEQVAGYLANSTLAPSSTQVERFVDAAHTVAELAVGPYLDRFVSCQPADPGCAEQFIEQFGRKVFRRPLTAEQIDAYAGDFDDIAAEQGAALGLTVVAQAMLASPHFLYVGERSELADAEAHAYDLASRLSYFVWATMPDEILLDAAASGELSTREGVEAQVRRMLDDERAADMLATFSGQWLEIDGLAQTPKHPESFPQWTPELADAAELESIALFEHVVLDGDGRLESVLQSRQAYVDAELAALYGVPAPAGGAGWVELPAQERAGVLTRTAFLAGHAHADENSWVHRGKLVRERLLCGTLPPPPPMADDNPVINDESRLNDDNCKYCHVQMDLIGMGFDGYDPVGRFAGGSAPGEIFGFEDMHFDGALELSQRLATAPEVHACFAEQMFRYANRRELEDGDDCAVQQLTEQFADEGGDIAQLIVSLAMTDSFLGGEL